MVTSHMVIKTTNVTIQPTTLMSTSTARLSKASKDTNSRSCVRSREHSRAAGSRFDDPMKNRSFSASSISESGAKFVGMFTRKATSHTKN